MGLPLIDIDRELAPLRDELLKAVARVLDHGHFVHGPECQEFEQRVAELCRAKHAVACASGSDALLLALMALQVGPGDEVIVPSFTFFATASCVVRLGARPVFVDVDPNTYCLEPRAVADAITPATKGVIPVHLFGQCAPMKPLRQLAKRHQLFLLEDAAQAIGARYQGELAGSLGTAACFSFYPTKNLGGCGDGGLITTSDAALAERLVLLRSHGMQPRYVHQAVGINSRLDTIQAALLNVKLSYLEHWSHQRRRNAERYHDLFHEARLDQIVQLPTEAKDCHHVWNQFTIRVPERRDALRQHLTDAHIGTEIYYPLPLHRQPCFASQVADDQQLPETDRAAEQALSLPIFPALTEWEQRMVVSQIGRYFHGSRSRSGKAA